MSRELNIDEIVFDRYKIVDMMGSGGEGMVFKAIDECTGQHVTIKQLISPATGRAYDQAVARFQRAAEARFNHPNVVDPIGYGQENGEWLMVMPFIEGSTLDEYVRQNGGTVACAQAVAIVKDIASGLSAIHHQGYVHRDIKPQNIMIDGNGQIYIIDLGICSNVNDNTITDGSGLLGTLYFISPEQALKPTSANAVSDIFSLGALFYMMLTGVYAVTGKDVSSLIHNICNVFPPAPSTVNNAISQSIDSTCLKMLAKDPNARFQRAEEVITALDNKPSASAGPAKQAGFCISCGTGLHAETRYCHTCGANQAVEIGQAAKCFACGTITDEAEACSGCRRRFSPSDHRLTFLSGTLTGSVFRIPEGNFYVGRNELSDRDFTISRRHLSVQCVNGTVYIEDAGSANHTFVARQEANRRTPLVANCELAIASNTATYNHI